MNIKMTTNSQLSTMNLKKQKQKQNKVSKQLEQEQNHRNGNHMEGYQWGEWEGKGWEKLERISNINGR